MNSISKNYLNQVPASRGYTFGLDIGIASVGWAVLSDTQIVDWGVRCFDKAETSDIRGEIGSYNG